MDETRTTRPALFSRLFTRLFALERPPEVVLIAILLFVWGVNGVISELSRLLIYLQTPNMRLFGAQILGNRLVFGWQIVLYLALIVSVLVLLRRISWAPRGILTVFALKICTYIYVYTSTTLSMMPGGPRLEPGLLARLITIYSGGLLANLLVYGMIAYLLVRPAMRMYLAGNGSADELAVDHTPDYVSTPTSDLLTDVSTTRRSFPAILTPFAVISRSAAWPELALIGVVLLGDGIRCLCNYAGTTYNALFFHFFSGSAYTGRSSSGFQSWFLLIPTLAICFIGIVQIPLAVGLLRRAPWSRKGALAAILLSAVTTALPLLVGLNYQVFQQLLGKSENNRFAYAANVSVPTHIFTTALTVFLYAAMAYLLTRPNLVHAYDRQEEAFATE